MRKANSVASNSSPNRVQRRRQNIAQIGDAAIAEGMPEERRGAWIIHEPYDNGAANEYLAEMHSGEFAKRRADANLPWMKAGHVWIPSEDSQQKKADALAAGLRWLRRNDLDLTTANQEHVRRMGIELAKSRSASRVSRIQQQVLEAAQWCVWTGRREALRVDSTPYKVRRGGHIIEGHRAAVVAKVVTRRIRYIDQSTQGRIVLLVKDIAERIAIRFCFKGCRGAESAGVENARVPTSYNDIIGSMATVFGKGGKWRDVPVDDEIMREVRLYRDTIRPLRVATFKRLNRTNQEPTALLLNKKNGRPLTYAVVRRAFKKAAAALGVDFRLHEARHAFACDWLASNAILMIRKFAAAGIQVTDRSLKSVLDQLRLELSGLMGHTSFSVTKIYLARAREAVLSHLAAYREHNSAAGTA